MVADTTSWPMPSPGIEAIRCILCVIFLVVVGVVVVGAYSSLYKVGIYR